MAQGISAEQQQRISDLFAVTAMDFAEMTRDIEAELQAVIAEAARLTD